MKYHFRVHDKDGLWAECVELKGCVTQGKTREELGRNMKEALDLYLEEPANSAMIFPFPSPRVSGSGIVAVEVEPAVAFSLQLRQLRIRHKLTQREAASRIGMRSLYSYQRLERRSNPSLATIKRVKSLFPQFSLDSVLGD
jgi:antitoxin HicB